MLHKKKNAAVFGGQVSAEMILEGRVEPPVQFKPLYALLDELCRPRKHPSW